MEYWSDDFSILHYTNTPVLQLRIGCWEGIPFGF